MRHRFLTSLYRCKQAYDRPFGLIAIFGGSMILAFILSFTEFFAPISGDTAIYAYYGRQILKGQLLYRDLWDFKMPGIYYLFAAVFRILPDSLLSLRFSLVIVNLVTSILLFITFSKIFSKGSGVFSAGVFLIITNLGGYLNQDGPYPESFIPILSIVVLLFWYLFEKSYPKSSKFYLFVAGIAAGTLFILKQTSISLTISIIIFLIWQIVVKRKQIIDVLLFIFGVFSAVLPWGIFFLTKHIWEDFFYATVIYPYTYASQTPIREAIHNLTSALQSSFLSMGALFLLALLGFLYWIRYRKEEEYQIWGLFVIWVSFGFVIISISGRFYERYLMEVIIPLIALSTLSVNELFFSKKPGTDLPELYVSIITLLVLETIISQAPRTLKLIDDRIMNKELTRSEYLSTTSLFSKSTKVFAWGDPRIPYVTHTESSVRWLNIEPFFGRDCSGLSQDLLFELNKNTPNYYFETSARPKISESCLAGTEVEEYLYENYVFTEIIGDTTVYSFAPLP